MKCQLCQSKKQQGENFFTRCKSCSWQNDDAFELFFPSEMECTIFSHQNGLDDYNLFDSSTIISVAGLPDEVIEKVKSDIYVCIATFFVDLSVNDGEIPTYLWQGWSRSNSSTPDQWRRKLALSSFA